jgi:uncharacterized membrane protein
MVSLPIWVCLTTQTIAASLPGSMTRDVVAGACENGLIDPLANFPEIDAVVWKHGQILDLGTLGGNASAATAMNNRGQVTGNAYNTIPDPFFGT